MKRSSLIFLLGLFACTSSKAQNDVKSPGVVTGNVSVLWQSYQEDTLIGAVAPPSKTGFNAFSNLIYTQGNFSAGIRYESYLNSVLGFPGRFSGTGVGYRFARYEDRDKGIDVTIGNFYEQFGNGMLYRSYEARNLGLDNAMDGIKLILTPIDALRLKVVYGKQRLDFDNGLINGDGIVRGVNAELSVNDLFSRFKDSKFRINPEFSFVSRFQEGGYIVRDDLILELPQNVAGWDAGTRLQYGTWSAGINYTHKINDPTADNGYIYGEGRALNYFLSGNVKKVSFLLQRSTSDNMSFRSDRDLLLFDVPINNIPAITKPHTYNLAATLYPYATVINGESSFRGELYYSIPRGSKIGGKYGTKLSLVYAAAYSPDRIEREDSLDQLIYGSELNSWGFGETLNVQDLSIEVERKFTKNFSAKAMYMNLKFNTLSTPVTTDYKGIVDANIAVLETQFKTKKRQSLRTEIQILITGRDSVETDGVIDMVKQDKGDWATFVAEYTWSPNWFVGIIDQYNFGNPDEAKRIHYLFGSAGYINGPHRISIGYGKRREGIFCVGGVCRSVPASNGFEVTFTSSF
tara:strand:+ start:105 stop:1829 length:1725 start_codon:yes stop_codon:yes gene_type:complete